MAVVAPEHWFLPPDQTPRRPHFTTGNSATAFVDGMAYFADLRQTLLACDANLLIAGWRVSGEQVLNPTLQGDGVAGDKFVDLVAGAARRGCSVRALLFNVPGTQFPGPFRIWHAKDNVEFARAVNAAGGEAVLDSRLAQVPASAHHQKFILATSRCGTRDVAYVGGIDVCLDRWDRAAHDNPPQRQRDHVHVGAIETHTASQPGWHDVQVRVAGPVLTQIWEVFGDRWNDTRAPNRDPLLADFRGRTRLSEPPSRPAPIDALAIQVNQTLPAGVFPTENGPGEHTAALAHERAIDRAEHYVYIEDQYVWPCSLVERLEAALARGVHVLLVVARDYDAPGLSIMAKRLRGEVVARLAKAGGDKFKIFHVERDDGKQIYVHSKVLIVDDCYASVGSANFNARSLVNDTELQLGIVDTELVDVLIGGQPQRVCRFAFELRCALWAEHLECSQTLLHDPIAAIDSLWARAPLAPSRRARRHIVKHAPLDLDPIAEYITTLVTERLVHVPHVPMPADVSERSLVKVAVDAVLRGPQAALLLKFLEEMLNPDLAPAVASVRRAAAAGLQSGLERPGSPLGDSQQIQLGPQILHQLRRGELPQMVDWFDPALLVRIGIRDVISGTIGQYADQRLMQAASDAITSETALAARYDYSDTSNRDPHKRIAVGADGEVWVDYVADLGDGFEATYAVAHLLAHDELAVASAKGQSEHMRLPAGQILVMGGDQCYPQGTQQEYERRLLNPYNWAFSTDHPKRKLFAIPGNHDWYDGLNAFSSLFTSARDRISGGIGRQIGGWRCYQHRSYFALKLPHGWWIWGPDIQLEGSLDEPQRDYFDIVSDHTSPGDKIVICLAEPSWHHQNYDNLHEISMLARKRGAKVCAVLAGDWHHYSRYTNAQLGVQFITSGGGGAFAHATHQLKSRLDLHWVELTGEPRRVADAKDPLTFNRMEARIVNEGEAVDFTMKDYPLSTASEPDETAAASLEATRRRRPMESMLTKVVKYDYHAPRIYPSKARSRLLALQNLLLPFRNRSFALFVGLIYFLYAWVFEISAPKLDAKALGLTPDTTLPSEAMARLFHYTLGLISPARIIEAARSSPAFFFMLIGLWAGLVYYVELGAGWLSRLGKLAIGTAHFLLHLSALLVVSLVAFLPAAFIAATPEALLNLSAVKLTSEAAKSLTTLGFMMSYATVSVLLGGFVGAVIMGIYWTLTSLLLNMHCGDAFGALMIKDYKHFLRMRFDADTLTIYPIAIDKVPGRRGWRVPTPEESDGVPSQIVPKTPLAPHLIEPPIVIKVSDIRG